MKKLDAAGQHSIVGTDQVKVPGFPSPLLLRPGAGVAREERRTVEELDGGRNGPRLGMSVTSHLREQWATERRTGKAKSEPRQAALRDGIGNPILPPSPLQFNRTHSGKGDTREDDFQTCTHYRNDLRAIATRSSKRVTHPFSGKAAVDLPDRCRHHS